jgi:transposase
VQTLHRVRDQLVGERTSLMNQILSLLLERGHIVQLHDLILDMRERWDAFNQRIAAFDKEQARSDERARRLLTIPGIRTLNATALVAAAGYARTFGLVPPQATTGGKPRLLGITKRGSKYLGKMPIQGARSTMPTLRKGGIALGAWLRGLLGRAHVKYRRRSFGR